MKKLVLLSSLLCSSAFASIPGYYVSAQLGYGLTQKSQVGDIKSSKNSALAGRIGIGYAVKPSYSMEIGLARFGLANWTSSYAGKIQNLYKANYYAFNWMNKLRLFHTEKFNFSTSLGLAYVLGSYSTAAHMQHANHHSYLRPELDLGGDYSLSKNLSLTASFYYIFGRGNLGNDLDAQRTNKYLPNIYGLLLGLNYFY